MSLIGPGKRITLNFKVSTTQGEVIDSTFERDQPPSFVFGDGSLLPGFEQAMLGLQAGQKAEFVISALDGFGEWREDNVQHFPRHQFSELLLEPGMVMHFADASGAELPGVIKAFPEGRVEVDFNHPLAGRDLVFEVDIIRVMDADASPVTLN